VISEFEYLAHDPASSQWLIGGTQDNGTDRRAGSPTWEHVADGDGGGCGVLAGNPNIVFHTFYYMSLERSTSKGDWNSWTSIDPPVPSGEGSLFYPPFHCSRRPGDTVAMGGDAVYVSRDTGDNWIRLAFPAPARAGALCVPGPDEVYIGTTDGRVFKTSWTTGPGWTPLSPLSTPRVKASIGDLLVDSNSPGRIWVTSQTVGGGRVFRSDDDGLSWTDCSAGLPQLPMNAVEVDAQDSSRVWVAADLGVYETRDAGSTWTPMSLGLPNAFVGGLLFHAQSRLLRAATRNRGVWEIQL